MQDGKVKKEKHFAASVTINELDQVVHKISSSHVVILEEFRGLQVMPINCRMQMLQK